MAVEVAEATASRLAQEMGRVAVDLVEEAVDLVEVEESPLAEAAEAVEVAEVAAVDLAVEEAC